MELLEVNEVCKKTRLKAPTVRQWANQRKIACVRLGRRMLIPSEEVERMLADGYRPAVVEQSETKY